MSLFNKKESKLSNYLDGYKKTNKSLAVKITELLGGYSANNDDIYEELLVLLISSDISVDNAEKIMDQLKERVNEQFVKNPKTISYMLADILKENYKDYQKDIKKLIAGTTGKLIVIDNADILLDDDTRKYISLDDKNQYLIIGRNPKNLFTTSDNLFELVSEKIGEQTEFRLKKYL